MKKMCKLINLWVVYYIINHKLDHHVKSNLKLDNCILCAAKILLTICTILHRYFHCKNTLVMENKPDSDISNILNTIIYTKIIILNMCTLLIVSQTTEQYYITAL